MTDIAMLVRALLAASPEAMPIAEARAAMRARRAALLAAPVSEEPDFAAPEPAHIADDPEGFAGAFAARHPDVVPRKPFDVIDGGKAGGPKPS